MKLLKCPVNGVRPLSEFAYGGECRHEPDPQKVDDSQWMDYVFNRDGAPGVKREWWYHIASGVWFVAERDTVNDVFVKTYQGPEDTE